MHLKSIKHDFEKIGKPIDIYGVPTKGLGNLNSTWISLENYISRVFREITNDSEWLDWKIKTITYKNIGYYGIMSYIIEQKEELWDKLDCPITQKLFEVNKYATKSNFDVMDEIFTFVENNNNTFKYEAIILDIKKKAEDYTKMIQGNIDYVHHHYPLLKNITRYNLYDIHANDMINYINAMYTWENRNLKQDSVVYLEDQREFSLI